MQKEAPGGVATEPDDHGLGRSRGGLTTKLHLAVEQGQKPLSIVVTAGQRHDSPQFQPVPERVKVRRTGPARPRTRPRPVRLHGNLGRLTVGRHAAVLVATVNERL